MSHHPGLRPNIGTRPLQPERGAGGSEFNPNNIPGLAAWYDASQEATTNGAAVSTFHDRSGNGRDLTNSTAGEQPVMATTIANGKPALQFSSVTSAHLVRTSGFLSGQTGSFFCVHRVNTTQTLALLGSRSTVTGTTQAMQLVTLAAANWILGLTTGAAGTGIVAGVERTTGTFGIAHQQSVGTSYTQQVNGVGETLTTAFGGANNGVWFGDLATPHNVTLGCLSSAAGVVTNPLNGYIAEVLIYDGVTLTTGQVRQVTQYLGKKYSITV